MLKVNNVSHSGVQGCKYTCFFGAGGDVTGCSCQWSTLSVYWVLISAYGTENGKSNNRFSLSGGEFRNRGFY